MGQYLNKIAKREKDGMIERDKEETMHSQERTEGEGSEQRYAHDQNDLNDIVIEPAVKPNGEPVSPVFWEAADGSLRGPCAVTYLAKDGPPGRERFWVIVLDGPAIVWVHESRLRTAPKVAE